MSKGNGKSVARGVPGAHGEGAGQAGQVSNGSNPDSSHVRDSGNSGMPLSAESADQGRPAIPPGGAPPRTPKGDFVFDMRTLGKRPGEFRDEHRTAVAPDGLGSGLALVPVGSNVALDLRFEAVSEGVLVTGSASAPLTGECARCLDPLTSTIEVSFQELYRYLPDPGEDENDGEERFLDGELLDLEPAFRDAVVLALPLSPLCRDDCPGLCAECGARLADVGPEHGHGDKVDPRWGALAKLDLNDRVED